jgi:hypothetical protein
LKDRVKDLESETLAKDTLVSNMSERVKEVEKLMEKEKKKC